MKTGNALLSAFFFGMAFYVPVQVFTLIYEHNLVPYIPMGFDSISFSLMFFVAFIVLGCVSLVFGIERRRKKKVELRPTPIECIPTNPKPKPMNNPGRKIKIKVPNEDDAVLFEEIEDILSD